MPSLFSPLFSLPIIFSTGRKYLLRKRFRVMKAIGELLKADFIMGVSDQGSVTINEIKSMEHKVQKKLAFLFVNDAMQTLCYNRVPHKDRIQIHMEIGKILEDLTLRSEEGVFDVSIIHHWEIAEAFDKCAFYMALMGDDLFECHRYNEALFYFQKLAQFNQEDWHLLKSRDMLLVFLNWKIGSCLIELDRTREGLIYLQRALGREYDREDPFPASFFRGRAPNSGEKSPEDEDCISNLCSCLQPRGRTVPIEDAVNDGKGFGGQLSQVFSGRETVVASEMRILFRATILNKIASCIEAVEGSAHVYPCYKKALAFCRKLRRPSAE